MYRYVCEQVWHHGGVQGRVCRQMLAPLIKDNIAFGEEWTLFQFQQSQAFVASLLTWRLRQLQRISAASSPALCDRFFVFFFVFLYHVGPLWLKGQPCCWAMKMCRSVSASPACNYKCAILRRRGVGGCPHESEVWPHVLTGWALLTHGG